MNQAVNGVENAVESKDDYVLASEQEEPKKEVPAQVAGEEQTDTQEADQKPKKLGGYQRRIQNLNNDLNKERQERLALAQELERLKSGQPVPKDAVKPAAAKADGEPDMNDFENVLDYLKAHQKWESTQAIKTFKETEAKTAQEQKAAQEYEEKQSSFNDRAEALLDKVPDFFERAAKLYQDGLITPQMEAAVLDSPAGEMVALYYMAHPQELQALQGMSEAQVYRAVALVEAKLVNGQQAPNVGKQTRAAAPINPIKATSGTQRSLTDDLPYEEWVKMRNEGLRR